MQIYDLNRSQNNFLDNLCLMLRIIFRIQRMMKILSNLYWYLIEERNNYTGIIYNNYKKM